MSGQNIRFVKATGAGNDFVVLDGRDGLLPADRSTLARVLCDRHFGIGADGLLVLLSSNSADFRMEYYNADGSSGGMCGNGGRVLARFAASAGAAGPHMVFEALGMIYTADVGPDTVQLFLPECHGPWPEVEVRVQGNVFAGVRINTGSPHFVTFVEDLENIGVERSGRDIRWHETFAPAGTNVDFVRQVDSRTIQLRTYERGVERETLACGTGSVASAIVARFSRDVGAPVDVLVRSGETLRVDFELTDVGARSIRLEGGARLLYAGAVTYDQGAEAIEMVLETPGKWTIP